MIDERMLDQACGVSSEIPRLLKHANCISLAAGALIMGGIGTAVSFLGSLRQGEAAQNQADFQADVAGQQAQRETENAKIKASDFARQASRAQATNRAEAGALGKAFSGSAVDVSEDLEIEKELNIQKLLNQGEVSSTRLLQSAELTRSAGRSAKSASQIKAGSTLISGASSFLVGGRKAGLF